MVDLAVVDLEHVIVATLFEVVQREVPPVVDGEQIACTPIADTLGHEGEFLRSTVPCIS